MKSIKGYKKRCLPVCLLLMLFINVLPAKAALDAAKGQITLYQNLVFFSLRSLKNRSNK